MYNCERGKTMYNLTLPSTICIRGVISNTQKASNTNTTLFRNVFLTFSHPHHQLGKFILHPLEYWISSRKIL